MCQFHLGITQNSEDISQAPETLRMIKSRIRRDSRQFVFMIYGTAFLKFTTITLSFNKMCIKNISKAFFQLSNMRLIFSICHEIEKLNYYSSTPLPTISSGLSAELLKTSLKHPPSPGGSPGALIRKLARKGWIEIISGWQGQRLSIKLTSMGKEEMSGVLSYLIMIWDHTQY